MNIETINPLRIAEKLEYVRNFLLPDVAAEIEKQPRIVEALWFLQFVSMPENYAGGIAKFTDDLIAKYSDSILPIGISKDEKPTVEDLRKAVMSHPDPSKYYPHSERERRNIMYRTDVGSLLGILTPKEHEEFDKMRRREISHVAVTALHADCIEAAQDGLAKFFFDACTDPQAKFAPWYFPKVWECLFDFMDKHSAECGGSLAETSITREIFKCLRLVQDTGKGVLFLGHSRMGKSRAIRSYAQMFPGKARLIECPSSGCETDFLREISRALGIRFASGVPRLCEQRGAIDKVIRSARFLLLFDESQMLFPQNATSRTEPRRLNYVRRQFMDNRIPVAFLCTHQNWKSVEKNFLKISSYSNEQWAGRLLFQPIHLSDSLTEEEMIEVARIHLPELDTDYLRAIVGPVRVFHGDHLSSIENIALLARSYAKERGQTIPRLNDLEKAMHAVLGCFSENAGDGVAEIHPAADPGRTVKPVASAHPISSDNEPDLAMNPRGRKGSLLRLNKLVTGQKNRIEDPALVLAD